MFTINKNYRITLGVAEGQESEPQEVLLHDNLLVAIQEQLYDLLCYCHGSTGHGGRDKTCALIRKHYTWVPKDLVSNFIKACPTCIMKKCGNMDVSGSVVQSAAATMAVEAADVLGRKASSAARLIAASSVGHSTVGATASLLGGHNIHRREPQIGWDTQGQLQRAAEQHRAMGQEEVFGVESNIQHQQQHRNYHTPSSSNSSGGTGRSSRRDSGLATLSLLDGNSGLANLGDSGVFGLSGSSLLGQSDRTQNNRNHSPVYLTMSAPVLRTSNTGAGGVVGAGISSSVSAALSPTSSSSFATHQQDATTTTAGLQQNHLVSISNSAIGSASLPWATLLGSSSAHHSHNPFQQHHHHPGLTLPPLMGLTDGDMDSATSSTSASSNSSPSHRSNSNALYSAYHQPPVPMVREVSLYKGLPNGWQYRHDDFESAHAEFMDSKRRWDSSVSSSSSHTQDAEYHQLGVISHDEPRIPDIAGFWGPDQFRSLMGRDLEDDNHSASINSMDEVDIAFMARGGDRENEMDLGHRRLRHQQMMSYPHGQGIAEHTSSSNSNNAYPIPPPMMRHIDMSDFHDVRHQHHSLGSPTTLDVVDAHQQHEGERGYLSQIDPVLLALASASSDELQHQLDEEQREYEEDSELSSPIFQFKIDNSVNSSLEDHEDEREGMDIELEAQCTDAGAFDPYSEVREGGAGMLSTSSTVTSLNQRRGHSSDLHLDLSRIIDARSAEFTAGAGGAEPSRSSRVSVGSGTSNDPDSAKTLLSPFTDAANGPSSATTPETTPVREEEEERTLDIRPGEFMLQDNLSSTTGTGAGDEVVKEFINNLVASDSMTGMGLRADDDGGTMEDGGMSQSVSVEAADMEESLVVSAC